jgi:cytochrome c-type biogenesis protein CcmH/NrfG
LSAAAAGLPAGLTAANKALGIYATYLERSETAKQALFMELAGRAEKRTVEDPNDPAGWYCMAYALGRNSQSLSIAKALALGLGVRIKSALETTIRLSPRHADAHTALGTFHAEVVDKVGALLGHVQGASKDAGLAFHQAALRLNPGSPIAMIEYARGMVMLEGDKRIDQATELYRAAAAVTPMDAAERLDVETAKAELDE